MGPKMKTQVREAVRHGAGWFTAAGLSAGVFVWMVVETVKALSAQ